MYAYFKNLKNLLILLLFCTTLCGCVIGSMSPVYDPHYMSPKSMSELQQGKRFFEAGYYKRAMIMLLPLACDGYAEAEYAVGYMYYYGYGVAQDTNVGYIWIKRAADQGFQPAIDALMIIKKKESSVLKNVSTDAKSH